MEEFMKVAKVSEIPEGGTKTVKAGEEEILLARVKSKVYACSSRCTHLGLSLAGGKLEGTVLTCPQHRSSFDLTDGKVLTPPAKLPLKMYEVDVRGEDVFVKPK